MISRFKIKPIFKDIFLTFATNIIMFVSIAVIYRLLAKNFGPAGVGEYSLVKIVVTFFYPLIFLGLGIGLPYYIARTSDSNQRNCYLKTGTIMIVSSTLVFLIIINLFKYYFARIFFGNISYVYLVWPFSFLLMGLVVHYIVYFYFQGQLRVKSFNLLQILNFSLLPISILISFRDISIEKLITLMGIGTFTISFVLSLLFIKEFSLPIKKSEFKNSSKSLLSYSLPRIPGDFAAVAFFSLGPIFAAHFASIEEVGYFSMSQSLLNASMGVAIVPLGIVLLPKLSNLAGQKKHETIKENVDLLIGAISQCFIFLSFQLVIFADAIIVYWLGPEFLSAVYVMRIVFISVIFYAFYQGMKNILDAVEVKPINTINFSISLGVFILMSVILLFLFRTNATIISLSIAFTSGLICLGILTFFSIRKIYPGEKIKDLNYFLIAIGINILLGGVTIFIKPLIISKLYWLILFEVLMSIIYLSILWISKIDWIRQIHEKMRISH